MGMDVYGSKPKCEEGIYFRSNVWYWHPLWACLEDLYPNITSKVPDAHSNSGDGLGPKDSITLAKLLKTDLDNGIIEKYIESYKQAVAALPQLDCPYCDGLGVRTWQQELAEPITKTCNACNGTLKVAPHDASYYMDLDLMKEFQVFLQNCGGFQIH